LGTKIKIINFVLLSFSNIFLMKEKVPNINKLIAHWIDGSDADYRVMMDLYKT